MIVMKFGGSVLKNKQGFFKMADVLSAYKNKPVTIVVSAFSKSTSMLKESALLAESGIQTKAFDILNKFIDEHKSIRDSIIKEKKYIKELEDLYNSSFDDLKKYISSVSITQELSPRITDIILSYGELLALHTTNCFLLELGYKVNCIDSRKLITTNSNFGKAAPDLVETEKNVDILIPPETRNKGFVLTQGFVGANKNGETTTMGIESSNLTAVLLAKILNAKELILWTDVKGIRTADPKIVNNTKLISSLSFDEARILSDNGLKLIYPDMLDLAESANISITYKSANYPTGGTSVISSEKSSKKISVILLTKKLTFLKYLNDGNSNNHKINNYVNDNQIKILYKFPDSTAFLYENKTGKKINHNSNEKVFKGNLSLITIINAYPEILQYVLKQKDLFKDELIFQIDYDNNSNTFHLILSDSVSENMVLRLHKFIFDGII